MHSETETHLINPLLVRLCIATLGSEVSVIGQSVIITLVTAMLTDQILSLNLTLTGENATINLKKETQR